ncbi:hypothetical protein BABINDRAFT_160014 [Babjeviella inositovora NRRL Y-12698]|uniref:Protein SYM1 n=1 Tax=Babjeviella inositovora NRRL Y-12698 TaxID=984486 RepID=A0A1E3QVS9_9ASCO|nr:uncharacterized protein BABINDRAFT_160014 [Babjeviella inositovora NRRL Y-12698]ODQ81776.1 hypothetical protein BABINDRAFT_160014 [Babjeviella inositovora NRRL Y-12698]
MSKLFSFYKDSLRQRPLVTNIITTGLLSGLGDVIAQKVFPPEDACDFPIPGTLSVSVSPEEERNLSFNYARLGRAMLYGGFVFAPIADKWFRTLNKIQVPASTFRTIGIVPTPKITAVVNTISRVFVDQAIFPTVISVPIYYTALTLLEHKSFEEAKKKLRLNYWPTLTTAWTVWPTIQLFNFGFVKVEYRLFVISTVSLGWNCYLSFMNGKKAPEKHVPVQFP